MKYLIKIGGSLVKHPNIFKTLVTKLGEYFKSKKFVIITGGGELADIIRKYYEFYSLSDNDAHWMAINTQDMLARIVNSLLKKSVLINHLSQIENLLSIQIPVIEPSNILKMYDELPHSWDVTGDSIAIFIAKKLHINNVILIKDVDGLFESYNLDESSRKLLKRVDIDQIKVLQTSCIDKYSIELLKGSNINCFLVNGFHPDRILSILTEKDTIYTKIIT
ncbi:MAG: amino acid kinase family protein [Candidatus Helarchaeota archaeon]